MFFVLTYGFGGNAQSSNLCRLGILIEPLTMFFGLKWQDLMAFCSSAISKESLMGVLNTLMGPVAAWFTHLQRKGIQSSRFRHIRNPVLQLRQGRGACLHLCHQLQYALRQCVGC